MWGTSQMGEPGLEPELEPKIQAWLCEPLGGVVRAAGVGHGSPGQWEDKARELTFLEHLLTDQFIGAFNLPACNHDLVSFLKK